MRNSFYERNLLKYIAIILVLVIVVAGYFAIKKWDSDKHNISVTDPDSNELIYNGKKYTLKENVETLLVLGLDKYEDSQTAASHTSGVQTDFLILFVFDNDAKTCTAIQINRDTITRVDKLSVGSTAIVESYQTQIALAYNYVNDDNDKVRCRNTKSSVQYLLDNITVNHYLSLTMDAVPECIDFLGGVEVTIQDDFSKVDASLVKGQTINLSGNQALTYIRARGGVGNSSNVERMNRQQQFIKALYEKLKMLEEKDENSFVQLVDKIDEYLVYDFTDQKMKAYAQKLKNYEFCGIKNIEGETKTSEYVEFYPDKNSINEIVVELFYKESKDK